MEFTNVERVQIADPEILEEVKKNYYPDDVFDREALEGWALNNGFVRGKDETD